MIKSVTVTNYLGDNLKLELAKPELSGLLIESIDGLGPGKADINMFDIATGDGSHYNSSRLPARNIVINLRFLWNSTIEESRLLTYTYFPIKKKLMLLIETDKRLVEIDGYVESNEPEIFSINEGASISIICPDPYFYLAGSESVKVTQFYDAEAVFEFPFSNESTIEPQLIMSNATLQNESALLYEGDAEIGMTIKITATGDATNVRIYDTTHEEMMFIDTSKISGTKLKKDDVITICTVKGNKHAILVRNGVSINILNAISIDSSWFRLTKGYNYFYHTADTGNDKLMFLFKNRVAYEGV